NLQYPHGFQYLKVISDRELFLLLSIHPVCPGRLWTRKLGGSFQPIVLPREVPANHIPKRLFFYSNRTVLMVNMASFSTNGMGMLFSGLFGILNSLWVNRLFEAS